MELKPKQGNDEAIVTQGTIFELVQETQPDGRVFERVRRAPGVRIIIADLKNKKVLLTREFRTELNDWDYRLPGGKLFDTLDEFAQFRESGASIDAAVQQKAIAEAREEAGVAIRNPQLYAVSKCGAIVEWDLHVCVATEWRGNLDQQFEDGEQIDDILWYSFDEIRQMILDAKMQEERIALILLRWIEENTNEQI